MVSIHDIFLQDAYAKNDHAFLMVAILVRPANKENNTSLTSACHIQFKGLAQNSWEDKKSILFFGIVLIFVGIRHNRLLS